MAMRATMMSRMTPMEDSTTREPDSMPRKVLQLLLVITASAVIISFLFKQQTGLPLLLSTFFADASLGLIAGFGSRSLLRERSLYIRSMVAILLALIGMLVLGALTQWVLGVGPMAFDNQVVKQIQRITFQRNLFDQAQALKIDWPTLIDFSKMNWADPVHLAISMLMAGLALDAWPTASTAPASEQIELEPVPSVETVAAPAPRPGRRAASTSNGRAHVHLPGSWFPQLGPSPTPRRRTRSNRRSQPPVQAEAKIVKAPVVRPKRRRSRRKPKIQFALVEEHRCPYCLDAVTRNDPRGVKECEVCHTLHHADCWSITGVCQVPHLNT
jgi:hypothetical protein